MAVNFAYEYKKFEEQQARLRKEYKAAGMSEEQIAMMYKLIRLSLLVILHINAGHKVCLQKVMILRAKRKVLCLISLWMYFLILWNPTHLNLCGG